MSAATLNELLRELDARTHDLSDLERALVLSILLAMAARLARVPVARLADALKPRLEVVR